MKPRRLLGILGILKRFCTQYRFQIANSADALFQHVSRHWNWGRYKICIWFRNFSVSSVFIRTNPYLNSAHGKGSAFPANLLYGWIRIGTESRGNQYGRTRSADNVFLRPESLLPNNTDRIRFLRGFRSVEIGQAEPPESCEFFYGRYGVSREFISRRRTQMSIQPGDSVSSVSEVGPK